MLPRQLAWEGVAHPMKSGMTQYEKSGLSRKMKTCKVTFDNPTKILNALCKCTMMMMMMMMMMISNLSVNTTIHVTK